MPAITGSGFAFGNVGRVDVAQGNSMMKFGPLLISAGALMGAMCMAAVAQSTMPPQEGPASSRNQEPAQENGSSGARVQSHDQAREPNDPVETSSGGSPASSPQGDAPPGMQPLPKGESTEDGHKSGASR